MVGVGLGCAYSFFPAASSGILMKESVSLGSAFTSSAKFSPSLDQDLVSQPLWPRRSVSGFLSIWAARSSSRYCSSSFATPMK